MTMRSLVPVTIVFLSAFCAFLQSQAVNDRQTHGAPRYRLEPGWQPLLNGQSTAGWHAANGKPLEWFTTREVRWENQRPNLLLAAPAPGDTLVNGPTGRTSHLVSDQKFGDVELYLEFLIPKDSNSGVYLHGLYEVQIKDTYGVKESTVHDCGAIYERWIDGKGVGGTPPLVNATRPAGQWQSYEIWFRAPRFEKSGRKVENARFLRVLQNGILVQENAVAEGPTRASLDIPEAPGNPLMLQGDHGAVAFRNIYIRPLRPLGKD
jgi:hypothetical protein